MSFKFSRTGPTYPTEVKGDELHVCMCGGYLSLKFGWLLHDYPYQNIWFPTSNIMAYLVSDEDIVVMRFDGTVTKFTHNYEVIGFDKFDPKEIMHNIITLPVGSVYDGEYVTEYAGHRCAIRFWKHAKLACFECTRDPEPFEFSVEDNPEFIQDILKGNELYPALVSNNRGQYTDVNGKYTLVGNLLDLTGTADI